MANPRAPEPEFSQKAIALCKTQNWEEIKKILKLPVQEMAGKEKIEAKILLHAFFESHYPNRQIAIELGLKCLDGLLIDSVRSASIAMFARMQFYDVTVAEVKSYGIEKFLGALLLTQDNIVAKSIIDYVHKNKVILGSGLESNPFIHVQEKEAIFTIFNQLEATEADIESYQFEQQQKQQKENETYAEAGNFILKLAQGMLGLTIENFYFMKSGDDDYSFYAEPNLKKSEDYQSIIEMLKNLDIKASYVCIPASKPQPYIQIITSDFSELRQILNTAYSTMQAMQKMQKLTIASSSKAEKPSSDPSPLLRPASPSAMFHQPAAAATAPTKDSTEIGSALQKRF